MNRDDDDQCMNVYNHIYLEYRTLARLVRYIIWVPEPRRPAVRYRYSLHRSRALIPRGRRTRRSSSSGREGGKNPGLRAAV
jgi:hypothetical protein